MIWLFVHRNLARIVIFAIALVAIVGPWWFDQIFVPSEYTCSYPNIRLKGDFCGIPMSGIWIFVIIAARFIELAGETFNGTNTIPVSASSMLSLLLVTVFVILLVLPLFTTWILILRGEHKFRQIFQIVAWGLAACAPVIWGLSFYRDQWSWALWGIPLSIGLAICALIFEILVFSLGKKPPDANKL